MVNIKLIEAKNTYMETGRLNHNIVNKDIAISWYKCKLQNMKPNDPVKQSKHITNNPFDIRFLDYIDSIVSEMYQYVLSNTSLQICKSRLIDKNLTLINSIDDLLIGTNGGYNSVKNHALQIVSKEEHFLDVLSNYHTIGIPIVNDDKCLGNLMIISEHLPNEYDLNAIREKLSKYYSKAEYSVISNKESHKTNNLLELSKLFVYPKQYWNMFVKQIESVSSFHLPTLISGSIGSGRTTLAWYLGLSFSFPAYLNLKDLDPMIQKCAVEQALLQNDTVIIENLEFASKQTFLLLTVYTDKKSEKKSRLESSDLRCKNLILTTVNNTEIDESKHVDFKMYRAIIEKLKFSTIYLENLDAFGDFYDEILLLLENRMPNAVQQSARRFECEDLINMTFKELILKVLSDSSESEEDVLSLEDNEKEYILKIYNKMNKNIALTSNVLQISRSTLYRKLEKYQNETF